MTVLATYRSRIIATITAFAACLVLMCGFSATAHATVDSSYWGNDGYQYVHDDWKGWYALSYDGPQIEWMYEYNSGIWYHITENWDGWMYRSGDWLFYDQNSQQLYAWMADTQQWVNYNDMHAGSPHAAALLSNMSSFNYSLNEVWVR